MVIESAPTMTNLLGLVEREFLSGGMVHSDHLMLHAGSLLHADGGFLILEARAARAEPGTWKVLARTLRTGRLEIIPSELVAWGDRATAQARAHRRHHQGDSARRSGALRYARRA